jgi:hypothetical protein
MKESIYNHVIVYCLWINGRSCDDVDQHFPIESYNVKDRNLWQTDFKKVTQDYFKAKVKDSDDPNGYYTEIYQDYTVILFSIDIDVDKFEKHYNLKFDIENDDVQDYIPYYVNYDFNTVAERIAKFSRR